MDNDCEKEIQKDTDGKRNERLFSGKDLTFLRNGENGNCYFGNAKCTVNGVTVKSDFIWICDGNVQLLKGKRDGLFIYGAGIFVALIILFAFVVAVAGSFCDSKAALAIAKGICLTICGACSVMISNWYRNPANQISCWKKPLAELVSGEIIERKEGEECLKFLFADNTVLLLYGPGKTVGQLKELIAAGAEQETEFAQGDDFSGNNGSEDPDEKQLSEENPDEKQLSEENPDEEQKTSEDGKKLSRIVIRGGIAALLILVCVIVYQNANSPDRLAWNEVKDGKRSALSYSQQFPNGRFVKEAGEMLRKEKSDFEEAKESKSYYQIKRFFETYPHSSCKDELEKCLNNPEWVMTSTDCGIYYEYLQKNTEKTEARAKIAAKFKRLIIEAVLRVSSHSVKTGKDSPLTFARIPYGNIPKKVTLLTVKNATDKVLSFFITDNGKNHSAVYRSVEILPGKSYAMVLPVGKYDFAFVQEEIEEIEKICSKELIWFSCVHGATGYGSQQFDSGIYSIGVQTVVRKKR